MIAKADVVGVRISAVLEGKTENVGTSVKEFSEAFWTDFVIRLESGLELCLHEYDLAPYTGNAEGLRPTPLQNICMDPALSTSYERSRIEGRKITFVGGEPHDSIYVFVDSGLGVGSFGGPGGNQISICEEMPEEVIDYWEGNSIQNATQHAEQ